MNEIEKKKYFTRIKLDKFIFLRNKIEKKYFIEIKLDKFIFFRDKIEKKFTKIKLKKIKYDKNENGCFLKIKSLFHNYVRSDFFFYCIEKYEKLDVSVTFREL